jgi:hypothetical protein
MKVMCIDESGQYPPAPFVKVGEIYTVVNIIPQSEVLNYRYIGLAPFYELEEIGRDGICYSHIAFAPLSEIDEKEFIREKEMVK